MLRVGFAGVPGSGKTSSARALAGMSILNSGIKNVELISEYAREYIIRYGSIESVWDEYLILENQLEWENRVSTADLMITDSPLPLILVYAQQLKKENSVKDVLVVEKILRKLNSLVPRYDVIFYLPPVIKPIKDGVRPELHFDEKWRSKTDDMIKSTFSIFSPKHFVIVEETDLMDRVNKYMKVLRII